MATSAPTTQAPTTVAPTTTTTAPSRYKVGDVIQADTWQVVAHGVNDPQASPNPSFDKPKAGNRRIGIDFEVKNIGSKNRTFSYLLQLELQDADNHNYNGAFTTVEPKAPDGDIEPGGSRRGIVVFEVPQAEHGFTLRFNASGFGTATIIDLGR